MTCGSCGKPVNAGDVTCPHCDALLAAWTSASNANPQAEHATPDYARPPADRPASSLLDIDHVLPTSHPRDGVPTLVDSATIDLETATNLVTAIHAIDRATASRVVNTIRAYARKRERDLDRALSAAPQLQRRSLAANTGSDQISNIAFAFGAVMASVIILLWGIVGAMVYTGTWSIEFLATTIILTLAFKPTMKTIRSAFK